MFLSKLIVVALGLLLIGTLIRSELKHVHYGEAAVIGGELLEIEGRKLKLWGVSLPKVESTCKAGRDRWPCGAYATAALMVKVGKGSVMCLERGANDSTVPPVRCFTTKNLVTWQDIGRELVLAGWAMPNLKDSLEYIQEASEAESAGRGLWRRTANMSP